MSFRWMMIPFNKIQSIRTRGDFRGKMKLSVLECIDLGCLEL